MRLFYGYVRSLDIDFDRLTRAFLHAIEPLFIGCNRGCRKKGHPRYQQILNKHLGTPRPGTVGVNTSTALIGPGSTIRAVGAKLPRIHGASKATARDYDRERGAYTDAMLGRGVAVKLTSAPVHESRGSGDLILIWLPHWVMDAAIPTFPSSAEVRRKLPKLPPKSTAILRLVPGAPTPMESAPLCRALPSSCASLGNRRQQGRSQDLPPRQTARPHDGNRGAAPRRDVGQARRDSLPFWTSASLLLPSGRPSRSPMSSRWPMTQSGPSTSPQSQA